MLISVHSTTHPVEFYVTFRYFEVRPHLASRWSARCQFYTLALVKRYSAAELTVAQVPRRVPRHQQWHCTLVPLPRRTKYLYSTLCLRGVRGRPVSVVAVCTVWLQCIPRYIDRVATLTRAYIVMYTYLGTLILLLSLHLESPSFLQSQHSHTSRYSGNRPTSSL